MADPVKPARFVSPADEAFHAHLDVCPQCEEEPFERVCDFCGEDLKERKS